jgi:tetratricopeptide (TPR) repeat protein
MLRAGRIAALVCALAVSGYCAERARVDSQRHYLSTQRYEDVTYVPPPAWLHTFSLGHREALAGLLWMRMLVYFGEDIVQRGTMQHLYRYADAVLSLDPGFIRAYRWIAVAGVYRPSSRGLEDVRKAIDYLERASKLAPDDGVLAWDLGSFYLYELRPMLKDEKEREDALRKGMEHLRVAILRKGAPPWVSLDNARLLESMGKREQQIAFLQDAYAQAPTNEAREQIAKLLAQLQSQSFAEAFTREQRRAEDLRKRDFPYLDMDLFLQVGPKPAYDPLPLLVGNFDPSAVAGEGEGADLE